MEGKKIVAGISGRRLKDGSYFIDSMYVDENHQNKGIGSHLLAFTLSQFPLETVWQADVAYKSWRSHHVYEKFAFGPIGKTRPEKDGFCYIRYRRN